MTAEPTPIRVSAATAPGPRRRRKEPAGPRPGRRSASASRRVQELLRGNINALRHGRFAVVALLPEVDVEVALTYAARPDLDPIRDRRLVEQFALAGIHLRIAAIDIHEHGLTEHLGAFVSRQAPLVERLERTLVERERQRLEERTRGEPHPLARYRSGGGS